jgi:hypothetical protein
MNGLGQWRQSPAGSNATRPALTLSSAPTKRRPAYCLFVIGELCGALERLVGLGDLRQQVGAWLDTHREGHLAA